MRLLWTPHLLPQITLSSEHRKLIEDSLKQMIGEWSGIGADNLEHTSTYGIRAYLNNSTLHSHVDRCETHILSAVYCVDDSYPVGVDRWPMVADGDLTGKRVSVVRFQRRRARHLLRLVFPLTCSQCADDQMCADDQDIF